MGPAIARDYLASFIDLSTLDQEVSMSRNAKVQFLCLSVVFLALAGLSIWRLASMQHRTPNPLSHSKNAYTELQKVAAPSTHAANDDSNHPQIEASYGSLPLSFEPNRGQTDGEVKFLSRAGNRTLWLTRDEAVLTVGHVSRAASSTGVAAAAAQASQDAPAVLRMKFLGTSNAAIAGEDKQSGTVNYFS